MSKLILVCALAAGVLAFGAATSTASAPVSLTVDDDKAECAAADFTSIQAAVNAADQGSVIRVCPGLYQERVIVSKPLTIHGSAEAVDAVEAVDCFAGEPLVADPTRHAVVSATDNLPAAWLDLRADNVDVQGIVFQGLGHVVGRRPLTRAVETSPDHSGYQLHHNVMTAYDVGVFFHSNGFLPSAFAHSCLRQNGWGLVNDSEPLVNARIHHNSTTGTRNFTFELQGGTQDVTLDHNHSQGEFTPYLFRFTTSTTAYDNSMEGVRFGIRLFGGNEDLQLISNDLKVTQGGIVSATNFQGVQLPANLRVLMSENAIAGTGTTPVGVGPWAGIGMGGGALKDSLIVENVVHDHYGEGIALLANNTHNEISENVVSENGADGIRLAAGATGNILTENRILGNGKLPLVFPGTVDARDDAAGSGDPNIWLANVCNTDSPPGTICGVQ